MQRDKINVFESKKAEFFSELIGKRRLSIQYVDYDADTLNDAIRFLHKSGNAGAIFIDYIQLIRMKETKLSRQLELKDICQDLKDVAVDTGLPLILGAQFSREVVNAARLHPTNIGEAGDIERIANVILGFWNNNFDPFAKGDETSGLRNYKGDRDTFYVKLLKNRGGRVGLAGTMTYDGNTGVISNYESSHISIEDSAKPDKIPF